MKTTNGWRIAGRVFGGASLILVTLTSGPIDGVTSALLWWGLFEFIGWLIDQSQGSKTPANHELPALRSTAAVADERAPEPGCALPNWLTMRFLVTAWSAYNSSNGLLPAACKRRRPKRTG